MPVEYNPDTGSFEFKLRGVLFSKVVKQKITSGSSIKARERVSCILPELVPIGISCGCTSSKISVPIPNQPALRMRMGFQGPTLRIIAYIHTYDAWKSNTTYHDELSMSNFYDAWKWAVEIEDLIKVSDSYDVGTIAGDGYTVFDANPKNNNYGDPVQCDLDSTLFPAISSTSYTALPQVKPGTYWWVRKREVTRESGWHDKFRLELELERSWQWSTTGRQRPARDIDVMTCFKDGESGYINLTKEYSSD